MDLNQSEEFILRENFSQKSSAFKEKPSEMQNLYIAKSKLNQIENYVHKKMIEETVFRTIPSTFKKRKVIEDDDEIRKHQLVGAMKAYSNLQFDKMECWLRDNIFKDCHTQLIDDYTAKQVEEKQKGIQEVTMYIGKIADKLKKKQIEREKNRYRLMIREKMMVDSEDEESENLSKLIKEMEEKLKDGKDGGY